MQGNLNGGIARHVEEVDVNLAMGNIVLPGFVFEGFYITDTVNVEYADVTTVAVETDDKIVVRMDFVGFETAVTDLASMGRGIIVEDDALLLTAGVLELGDGGGAVFVLENLVGNEFQPYLFGHLTGLSVDAHEGGAIEFDHTEGVWLHTDGHDGLLEEGSIRM